jgi:predicted deacetylase
LNNGILEFEKCFGFKPKLFKAPYLKLSSSNQEMLRNEGFDIYGRLHQVTHKVYHCNDYGLFSNRFIEKY